MHDLGIAFRTTRLPDALALLGIRAEDSGIADPNEAVEAAAQSSGLRSRRVLLDSGWWKGAGAPMIARAADRRREARPADLSPEETGWIAIAPRFMGGYRARAANAAGGDPIEWVVDDALAERLAPFAFTFHRTFARKSLSARDLMTLSIGNDFSDVAIVMAMGLVAALVGMLTPIATARLIDQVVPSADPQRIVAVIAGLAVAGIALIAFEVLRTLAVLRVDGRTGIATQAAVIDRIVSAPSRFFREYSSGDLAQRLAGVNTVQRSLTAAFVSILIAGLFVAANVVLMASYSPGLTAAALGVVAAAIALSIAIGLARVQLGRTIEALDGRIGSLSFEYLSGIAKLRAGAAEGRAFANWTKDYRERRVINRKSALLANFEAVVMSFLQPAATILVLLLAWRLMAEPGKGITTGTFVAFHAAMFALLGGVRSIVWTGLDLLHLKPLWERARPILETLPEGG